MNRICTKCGAQNAEDAKFCSGCGTPLGEPRFASAESAYNQAPPPVRYVPNYRALAIIAAIFCIPLGVPALVYASQVDGFLRMGQYEMAERHSQSAKKWSIWGLALVAVAMVLYFLFFIVVFGFAFLSSQHKSH